MSTEHSLVAIQQAQQNLGIARERLAEISEGIVRLLSERNDVVEQFVVPAKIILDLPAFVPTTHSSVIKDIRYSAVNAGINPDYAEAIFSQILTESVDTQIKSGVTPGDPVPAA